MGGASDETEGTVFDPHAHGEAPADLGESEVGQRGQEPVQIDASRYYKTGRAAVGIGKDGMPQILGEGVPEPEPGLTDDNFICSASEDGSRPECEHLVTLLLPADGIAKGFAPMQQIRHFCRWLATGSEQWEHRGDVFACSARRPKDPLSEQRLKEFLNKQKSVAKETAEKSGSLVF